MLRFIPAITWFIFITYLFLLPGARLPQEQWFDKIYLDKWVHTGFFFTLLYLIYIPLRNKNKSILLKLAVAGFCYGIVIEFIQRYCIPDRSFDMLDILFDGIGCTAAYIVMNHKLKK